eukprot:361251-Chlamydomonas_euryale.AAC.9
MPAWRRTPSGAEYHARMATHTDPACGMQMHARAHAHQRAAVRPPSRSRLPPSERPPMHARRSCSCCHTQTAAHACTPELQLLPHADGCPCIHAGFVAVAARRRPPMNACWRCRLADAHAWLPSHPPLPGQHTASARTPGWYSAPRKGRIPAAIACVRQEAGQLGVL